MAVHLYPGGLQPDQTTQTARLTGGGYTTRDRLSQRRTKPRKVETPSTPLQADDPTPPSSFFLILLDRDLIRSLIKMFRHRDVDTCGAAAAADPQVGELGEFFGLRCR